MYLLFDIGGTNLRVAVSDGNSILSSKIVPTPQDFIQGIEVIKQVANELSKGEKIDKVAGGIAIIVNKDRSMAVASTHMKGWINKPLKHELEKTFQVPVFLENDAKMEGLGEATRGAGTGKGIVAYISIGTGIGGARIVNGCLDKNIWGAEPGHQIIEINGKDCQCGGKGHLEAYVGGYYLKKYYGKPAKDITDPEIWDKVARYLSIGLNNTIVHWSPDIIVLGGSVTKSLSLEKIKEYLKKDLTIFPEIPEIVKAKLGDEGGLYGALALLL